MSDKYADAVEIGKKIADLQRQLDELKAKQPKEEKPFVRKECITQKFCTANVMQSRPIAIPTCKPLIDYWLVIELASC
jgi:hypothetical protein